MAAAKNPDMKRYYLPLSFIVCIVILALVASCKTEYWASKKLDQVHEKYPELMASRATKWYPPKITTQVTERTIIDTFKLPGITIYTNCDSVVNAAKKDPTVNTRMVGSKCPDVTVLKERIYRDSIASVENTARVVELELIITRINGQLSDKDIVIAGKDKELSEAIEGKRDWRKYALITWGILVVLLAIKLFGGYLKRLINPIT